MINIAINKLETNGLDEKTAVISSRKVSSCPTILQGFCLGLNSTLVVPSSPDENWNKQFLFQTLNRTAFINTPQGINYILEISFTEFLYVRYIFQN